MKFKDLSGKTIAKDITRFKYEDGDGQSKGERELGRKLNKLFPGMVYSQLNCFGTRMRIDFYIHLIKLAFEFDGTQHDNYVSHFHGSRKKFAEAKNRDWQKEEWCELNGIRLIRVNETNIDDLEDLISDN